MRGDETRFYDFLAAPRAEAACAFVYRFPRARGRRLLSFVDSSWFCDIVLRILLAMGNRVEICEQVYSVVLDFDALYLIRKGSRGTKVAADVVKSHVK